MPTLIQKNAKVHTYMFLSINFTEYSGLWTKYVSLLMTSNKMVDVNTVEMSHFTVTYAEVSTVLTMNVFIIY